MKLKLLTVVLFSFFCLPLFGQDGVKPDASKDPKLNALLWMQNASEFRLLTRQAYRYAGDQLQKGLKDMNWSADEVQLQEGGFQDRKPAVILDVDETVQFRLEGEHAHHQIRRGPNGLDPAFTPGPNRGAYIMNSCNSRCADTFFKAQVKVRSVDPNKYIRLKRNQSLAQLFTQAK